MSTAIKLTDYFKDKLKKDEEVGKSTLSAALPALGAQVVGNNTTPKLTDALKITTPTMTNPGTVNTQLLTGGANPTPNINADVLNLKFTPIASGNNTNTTAVIDNMPKYTDALGNSYSPTYTEPSTGDSSTGDSTYTENEIVTSAEPMTFEEYILSVKSKADDQYKRDILNAKNAYEQSKSAYGAQAAALGNMGLTGSGYSDYLDSKAYGQMQADKNAAARTREDTKLATDAQYMDYFKQQESNKQNAYTSLYSAIDYNTTEADIDALGAAYGLSSEQIANLKKAREDRVIAALDAASDYTVADLKRLLGENHPRYKEYFAKMADNAGLSEASFYTDDGLEEPETALQVINDAIARGADKDTLMGYYNKLYTIGTTASDGGTVKLTDKGSAFKAAKEGDNYKLVYTGPNGNEVVFKVQNGGKVEASDEDKGVLTLSKTVTDNTVFYYNGKLYLKHGEGVYRVEGRPLNTDDYNSLLKAFENDLKQTKNTNKES